jgi:hypothetical protein
MAGDLWVYLTDHGAQRFPSWPVGPGTGREKTKGLLTDGQQPMKNS